MSESIGYSTPPESLDENLTPAEARQQIAEIQGQVSQDSNHPYVSSDNAFLHTRFVSHLQRLHEVATVGKLDPFTQVCQDAMTEKAQRDTAMQAEGQRLVQELADDIGITVNAAGNLKEWEIGLLKMQNAHHENNTQELSL